MVAQAPGDPLAVPEQRWAPLPGTPTDDGRFTADLEGMSVAGWGRRVWVRRQRSIGPGAETEEIYLQVGLDCQRQLAQRHRIQLFARNGRAERTDTIRELRWERPVAGSAAALVLPVACRRRSGTGSTRDQPWRLPANRWQAVAGDSVYDAAVDVQGAVAEGRAIRVWVRERVRSGAGPFPDASELHDVRYVRWVIYCEAIRGYPGARHYQLQGAEVLEQLPYRPLPQNIDFVGISGTLVGRLCEGGAIGSLRKNLPAQVPDSAWQLAEGGSSRISLHLRQVSRYGADRLAWRRFEFHTPRESGRFGRYDRIFDLVRVDCSRRRIQVLMAVWYLGGQRISESGVADDWGDVVRPGTAGETMVNAICAAPLS